MNQLKDLRTINKKTTKQDVREVLNNVILPGMFLAMVGISLSGVR